VERQLWHAFCRLCRIINAFRRGRGTSFLDGREIVTVDEFGKRHLRSVAMQVISEAEICHGTEFLLRADARVRVQEPLQICLECRSKSKKCDKQITHIVRVTSSVF